MDIERGIEAEELEIAGTDVKCLVWDMDDVELAVRELALYPHFKEHFQEAFDLIDSATSFWLEDGSYADCAQSATRTMFRLRDDIADHASIVETASLPSAIRQFLGVDHPATDSQLAATFALVLSVQAVEILANWLFDLDLATYGVDADLVKRIKQDSPKQYMDLVERERDRRSGAEIRAREQFAIFKGEADRALLLARLYQQIERIDVSKNGFNASSLMHKLLGQAFSATATKRGQEAGNGNADPSSKTQTDAMDRRSGIKASAEQIIAGRKTEKRSLSDAELM